MRRRMLASLGAVLALGACPLGPDYRRPELPEVERFRGQEEVPQARSVADLPWWEVFEDPVLQGLLRDAMAQNLDLRIAAARVEEARAAAGADRWALYPTLGAGLGGLRQNLVPLLPIEGPFNRFYAVGMLDWELDVWGRLRRRQEAGYAELAASVEAQRGALVSLVAEVAQAYFELRSLDLQRDIADRRLEVRRKSLELFQSRLTGGTGNRAEVANAEALMDEAAAHREELERQAVVKENQLAVLLARPPGQVPRGQPLEEQALLPDVPAGLPSALLTRRPDVRQAEAQLVAANARVGATLADFFPRISLTGALGLVSPQLASLLSGDSVAWRFGGTADWVAPVLGGHRVQDAHAAARARFEAAAALYQRTVLVALRDVADALVARQRLAVQEQWLQKQVQSLELRLQLANERYVGGVANYLEVTTAEERLLPAQLGLAQVRAARLSALVALYRALGGGWEQPEAQQAQEGKASGASAGDAPPKAPRAGGEVAPTPGSGARPTSQQ